MIQHVVAAAVVVTFAHSLSPFSRWTRLAGVYWSKGWRSYKSCKAPVKSSPPTNQHTVFYRPDALPVTQPTMSKHWREISHPMDLLTPSSPGGLPTLSLTTNSSWLPWGLVDMPLISPLMPVPRSYSKNSHEHAKEESYALLKSLAVSRRWNAATGSWLSWSDAGSEFRIAGRATAKLRGS